MNLVWHIVRKDFRRLGLPLALWALLLIAKGEVGVRALAGAIGNDQAFYFSLFENTLVVLDVIVSWLLVAALVQEDALVGERMFWVTRPVSGRRLLAAKLVSAVLMFGGVPVLASLRWWRVCGYDVSEMMQAALVLAGVQVATVFPALVLATLTKNLNQFLAWTLGLGVVAVSGFFWLAPSNFWPHEATSAGESETRAVLSIVILLGGGMAAIFHQFSTRRLLRTGGMIVVTLALVAIVWHSTWDFSSRWKPTPPASTVSSAIEVGVARTTLDLPASIEYELRHVPESDGVALSADHSWRWRDGTSLRAQNNFTVGNWPARAEWLALGLNDSSSEALPLLELATVALPLKFSPKNIVRLRTEPAVYRCDLRFCLVHPRLEFEMPLRANERREREGFSVRIGRSEWVNGEWRGLLVASRPAFGRTGLLRSAVAAWLGTSEQPAPGFALVNETRSKALKVWMQRVGRIRVGAQEITWQAVGRAISPQEIGGSPSGWREGVTLAVVRYHEEGAFNRTLTLEHFGVTADSETAKNKSP